MTAGKVMKKQKQGNTEVCRNHDKDSTTIYLVLTEKIYNILKGMRFCAVRT